MKKKIIISKILLTFIISCNVANGQEVFSIKTLKGEWTYNGPENITIDDTITLSKEFCIKTEYTKEWIFYSNNEFSIYTRYPYNKETDTQKAIATKGDKWFYDNELKILKIQKHNAEQHFMIISYQEHCLKLLMIK